MPKPPRIPTVEEKPFMVLKPGQAEKERKYYRRFKDAQASVMKDLDWMLDTFNSLRINDAVEAIMDLKQQCEQLPESGGKVHGIFDPFTGIKYVAEIVKRQEVVCELAG